MNDLSYLLSLGSEFGFMFRIPFLGVSEAKTLRLGAGWNLFSLLIVDF